MDMADIVKKRDFEKGQDLIKENKFKVLLEAKNKQAMVSKHWQKSGIESLTKNS